MKAKVFVPAGIGMTKAQIYKLLKYELRIVTMWTSMDRHIRFKANDMPDKYCQRLVNELEVIRDSDDKQAKQSETRAGTCVEMINLVDAYLKKKSTR